MNAFAQVMLIVAFEGSSNQCESAVGASGLSVQEM